MSRVYSDKGQVYHLNYKTTSLESISYVKFTSRDYYLTVGSVCNIFIIIQTKSKVGHTVLQVSDILVSVTCID